MVSAQPDPINPLLANPPLPPFDIFSPYWSSPHSPLGAAWLPPTFPDPFGRFVPPLPMPTPGPPLPSLDLLSQEYKLFSLPPPSYSAPSSSLDAVSRNPQPPSFSTLGVASPPLNAQPNSTNPFLNIPPPQPFELFSPSDNAFPPTGSDRFGFTSDFVQASAPASPPVPTSLLQPVAFQHTLSSPSQPGSPVPAAGKLRSDQMINGLNGPLVQVAPPPGPFDRLIHALSDSWTSIKSILAEPLTGPFTLGDAIAAGLLPIPGVGEVADGAEAVELAAAISRNYRATFFAAHPELRGQVFVHHAVEQQVLKKYPGIFSKTSYTRWKTCEAFLTT